MLSRSLITVLAIAVLGYVASGCRTTSKLPEDMSSQGDTSTADQQSDTTQPDVPEFDLSGLDLGGDTTVEDTNVNLDTTVEDTNVNLDTTVEDSNIGDLLSDVELPDTNVTDSELPDLADVGPSDASGNPTIPQLQQETESVSCTIDGETVGKVVTLTNVVVTAPIVSVSATRNQFFVADPAGGEWSGIAVIVEKSLNVTVNVGDVVTLTGELEEFFCFTRILVTTANSGVVQVTGVGPRPQAVEITCDLLASQDGNLTPNPEAEKNESVLVKLTNVKVVAKLDFGEFVVEDANGKQCVLDNDFGTWPNAGNAMMQVGNEFDAIYGILVWSFGEYKVNPRKDNQIAGIMDLVPKGTTTDVDNGDTSDATVSDVADTEDTSTDDGFDGNSDDGFDGFVDDGFDGFVDDGFDGNTDDGFDGNTDDGFDGNTDDGFDGNTDDGFDGN
ncbi:MAG: hypothetical protein KC609_11230, partial [Myxococcales bacterium]|nr:hypothetical protein [Myxococcales bacterium]